MGLLWKEKKMGQKAKRIFEIKEKRWARKGKGLFICWEASKVETDSFRLSRERGEKKEVGGGRGRKQQEEQEEPWRAAAPAMRTVAVRRQMAKLRGTHSLTLSLLLSFFLSFFLFFYYTELRRSNAPIHPFPIFLNCRLNENLKILENVVSKPYHAVSHTRIHISIGYHRAFAVSGYHRF